MRRNRPKPGARVSTNGTDIVFATPGDAQDPGILPHALAHGVQPGGGRMAKERGGKALAATQAAP